ncbi:BatA domain-containing protein [Zavarzinella formosa]|uniref:BatA domain-containing protein n=1 Tax=Zavarzinella formosa TaxID=360055 RepID=UPI0002E6D149|nr:BatA domain-containing protein [Zavarzinella formosa]
MLFAITGLPILLTGAALVGLPVLLHLIMRQEPRRLPFPAFRFLKQKQQINQRKIRLRHLLLLLLRMALIALICLALWQPVTSSGGFGLRADRPIAAILVLDTSPSMGYALAERSGLSEERQKQLKLLGEPASGPWTCLDEARGRILEILDELPPESKVAILDTGDRSEPIWSLTLESARQLVRGIKKPKANSQPVTRLLESAYTMFARVDGELDPGQEALPRLLAVFSDRTATSWDTARIGELQSMRDRVPLPSIFHAYVDVGVDKPVNMAITTVEMKPQIVPAGQPVIINVTVEATGTSEANVLLFAVDGEEPQRIPVNPGPDKAATRQLRKDGLKPGLHQAKLSLFTPDALPFDNEKFITFRVREPRKVLAIMDIAPPSGFLGRALAMAGQPTTGLVLWKTALESVGWYTVDLRSLDDLMTGRADINKYELTTLLGVPQMTDGAWNRLAEYVSQGGRLIVSPGGPTMDVATYHTEAAGKVLPRRFDHWVDIPNDKPGITWTWNALSAQRPFLSQFRKIREAGSFFDDLPPITRGYWKVEDGAKDRIVVAYNDAPEPDQRTPAVLETNLGARGKVMQFTVPLGAGGEKYHNYHGGLGAWFYLVLVNEAVRSLTGDSEDQMFNFTNGQNVLVKWPVGDVKPEMAYYLSGPDVTATDATIRRDPKQPYYRLGPEKTGTAGTFTLEAEDRSWKDGFSLNPPVEESNLERLPPAEIENLFKENAVIPATKPLPLKEIMSGKFRTDLELFPFLMIILLLVMASENLLANKFYRRKKA